MRNNLIIGILCLAVIVQLIIPLVRKDSDIDYQVYREKIEQKERDIRHLQDEIHRHKTTIDHYKLRLNEKDSLIDIADKSTVRNMSNDFFRRHDLLRIK